MGFDAAYHSGTTGSARYLPAFSTLAILIACLGLFGLVADIDGIGRLQSDDASGNVRYCKYVINEFYKTGIHLYITVASPIAWWNT